MQHRNLILRLTPWLTAYLFLVSVGLPLQRVYCACVGEQWLTTVLATEHECHHDAKGEMAIQPAAEATDGIAHEGHHHAKKGSCCTQGEPTQPSACMNHDCGDAEVLIAQLDADFTFEVATLDLGLAAVLPDVAFTQWPLRPEVMAETPIRGPAPPPLPAGRSLLIAHQTFLI